MLRKLSHGIRRSTPVGRWAVDNARAAKAFALALISNCRALTWSVRRPLVIRDYFRKHSVRKLQLGTGGFPMEGWLNSDLKPRSGQTIFLDVTVRFPFEDKSLDCIHSEHMIEHLKCATAQEVMKECLRVLKPGGRIRIATPDFAVIAGLYTPDRTDIQNRYIDRICQLAPPEYGVADPCYVINCYFGKSDHVFVYDETNLRRLLEQAGFVGVKRYGLNESESDLLRGVDHHGEDYDFTDFATYEALILEASRPE